jgi:hypothetical protein
MKVQCMKTFLPFAFLSLGTKTSPQDQLIVFFLCLISALNSVGMLFEYQPATATQIKGVHSFPQSIHIIPRYRAETGLCFFHTIRRKHSSCHNNHNQSRTAVNTTLLNNMQFYSTQDPPLKHNQLIFLCKVTGQF